MHFYASGAVQHPELLDVVVQHGIPVLTSFAYEAALRKQAEALAKRLRPMKLRLPYMLDSGAVTSWSLGKSVSLTRFCDTCNEMLDRYADVFDWTFVALDKIPGRRGEHPTQDEVLEAAKETRSNYEHMRRVVRGEIKPVFHLGDPDWLADAYDDAEFVGLGASQNLPYELRRRWVGHASRRFEGRKLHGLAMTGTRMLRTAPWYSVDSASWILWAAYGAIAWVNSDGSLSLIPLSVESPRKHEFDRHLLSIAPALADRVFDEIEQRSGCTREQLTTDSEMRKKWNLLAFKQACDTAEAQGVLPLEEGLFDA